MKTKTTVMIGLATAAGLVLACGPAAWGGMTSPVYNTSYNIASGGPMDEWDLVSGLANNPGNPGGAEPYDPPDILDYYYSSFTRIDDFGVPSNKDDQLWWDLDGGAEVKAIYMGGSPYLGYSTDEAGGSGITWLSGSGGGKLDTVGETASFNIVPNNDAFVWVLAHSGSKYSRQALNPGGKDNMVTFRVYGKYDTPGNPDSTITLFTKPTYVIAFDPGLGDRDFQDFVAEVSNVAIPAPGAIVLGLMGLGAVGVWMRRYA